MSAYLLVYIIGIPVCTLAFMRKPNTEDLALSFVVALLWPFAVAVRLVRRIIR